MELGSCKQRWDVYQSSKLCNKYHTLSAENITYCLGASVGRESSDSPTVLCSGLHKIVCKDRVPF